MLLITLNFDVTSLLAQALLFATAADIVYHVFVVANKKFISVFVTAFRKSEVPGHHIGKSGCRLDNFYATTSLILRCSG